MQNILPAVIGGVLLLLGAIYWKWIKPKMDAKKKAVEAEKEARIKIEERRLIKDFIINRILPKIPLTSSISFEKLLALLMKEEEAGGGVLDMQLLKDSLAFGLDPKNAYLEMISREWALGRRGKDQRSKKG